MSFVAVQCNAHGWVFQTLQDRVACLLLLKFNDFGSREGIDCVGNLSGIGLGGKRGLKYPAVIGPRDTNSEVGIADCFWRANLQAQCVDFKDRNVKDLAVAQIAEIDQ